MIVRDITNYEPAIGDTLQLECGDTLVEASISDITDDGYVVEIMNEGVFDFLKKRVEQHAGHGGLESIGYIIGVDRAIGDKFSTIRSFIGEDDMAVVARAIKMAAETTPDLTSDSSFVKGFREGVNAVNSDDSEFIKKMVLSKIDRLKRAIDLLGENKSSDIVKHSNELVKSIRENRFPSFPSKAIYENRQNDSYQEWRDWTRNYYEYRERNANDSGRRITNIAGRYIAEHYDVVVTEDVANYQDVTKLLQKHYDGLTHPSKLKLGDNYDVVVIYVSKNNKTVEIDAHKNHTIKKVNYIKAENKYDVYTEQGLHGSSDWDDIGHVETLFFERPGTIGKQTTALALEVSGGWRGWTFSIMVDDKLLTEAEYRGRKVQLGKPMKGDVKKSKVYVKGPKGNVVKVNFGDKNMRIKKSNPKRRKSFRARHNCANPGPRWRARYWSCRAW